jgi:hypothetical protein
VNPATWLAGANWFVIVMLTAIAISTI